MKTPYILLLGLLAVLIFGWGIKAPPGQVINNYTDLQVNTITINAKTLGPCTMANQGMISFNDADINIHYACNGSMWLPMYNGTTSGIVATPYNDTWINNSLVNKTSVPDLNVNSSTWWAGLSGWINDWFFKDGNDLSFNEVKLNQTIDDRDSDTDTHIGSDGIYLTDDYTTMYFNETKLNETIVAKAVPPSINRLFLNGSDFSGSNYNVSRTYTFSHDFVYSVYAGNMALPPDSGDCSGNGMYSDTGTGITICPALADTTTVEVIYYG